MTRIYWLIALVLIVASIAMPAWFYPGLPDRIPTHWNFKGEVDGYGGKWTLFIFPVMMVFMLLLFYFMPALSPRHFEVDTFRPTYLYLMDVVLGLFTYMQAVLLYTVYQRVSPATIVSPSVRERADTVASPTCGATMLPPLAIFVYKRLSTPPAHRTPWPNTVPLLASALP